MRPDKSRIDHFATRLTFFRQANGYTQQQFADLLEINVRTYQRFESGELLPKIDFLYRFLEETSVSLDFFFNLSKQRRCNSFCALTKEQEDILAPIFFPCEYELDRWLQASEDPMVLEVLRGAKSSKSGNKAVYVSSFKGSYQSPAYCEMSGLAEFVPFGENTPLEVMADYWVRAIETPVESFLFQFEMTIGQTSFMVASIGIWAESLNRSAVYGTSYDLSQRPDVKSIVEQVCGSADDFPRAKSLKG